MSHIHRLPFLRGATILNAALLVSSSRGVLADPFLATSLHPPPFVSERALVDTDSTMPLSASLRRRINSSANRRPSSVCELAYTESEMISASAGRSCSCWTKSSTSKMLASVFQKNSLRGHTIDVAVQALAQRQLSPFGKFLHGPARVRRCADRNGPRCGRNCCHRLGSDWR